MTKINIKFSLFTLQEIPVRNIIKKCIHVVLTQEEIAADCEINVLVTDDMTIQSINKATRDLDKPTDVLSFPMFDLTAADPPSDWSEYTDPETGLCPLGDMAISLPRAQKQAKEFGHTLRREVGYLTIHSMLHLLGYDHLDEGPQKAQMRKKEESIAATVAGMQRS